MPFDSKAFHSNHFLSKAILRGIIYKKISVYLALLNFFCLFLTAVSVFSLGFPNYFLNPRRQISDWAFLFFSLHFHYIYFKRFSLDWATSNHQIAKIDRWLTPSLARSLALSFLFIAFGLANISTSPDLLFVGFAFPPAKELNRNDNFQFKKTFEVKIPSRNELFVSVQMPRV